MGCHFLLQGIFLTQGLNPGLLHCRKNLYCLSDRPGKHKWQQYIYKWYAATKPHQSYLTLCDPIDGSPPGSTIPGILQARTLEWVAISFSNAWKWKVKVNSFSRVRLFSTPWTAAYQAPPPMGFFQARVLEWVAIAFSIPSLSTWFKKAQCVKNLNKKWIEQL